MNDPFEIVGVRPELLERQAPEKENRWYQEVPWLSVIVLLIIAGGCLFCKWIMPKDPSYMDLKNYTVATMQGVSVWNRYHGERYFLHDMVRWTTVVVYRICGNNDINQYCDYLWNCQWSSTGMAGYVTYENDRDFAEHSQSAFGYFSAGDSGEGKCGESVAGYRSYKLDQYSESSKNRSASAKKQ